MNEKLHVSVNVSGGGTVEFTKEGDSVTLWSGGVTVTHEDQTKTLLPWWRVYQVSWDGEGLLRE